jgi:hypothetical protein
LSKHLISYVTGETNGVHREGVADHVTRPRAAKPQHDRRNFLRATRASDGYVLGQLGVRLLMPIDDVAG